MENVESPRASLLRNRDRLARSGYDKRRADPAELVLRALTSSANRKGSLERAQLASQRTIMLHTLRRHTARGAPVELTLMAFPFKVPNPAKVGKRRLPDLAELAAIRALERLRSAVRAVYEPGLRLHLILDGIALAPIVGIARAEVAAYEAYLRRLIGDAGAGDFIELSDYSALISGDTRDIAAVEPRLRRAAKRWLAAAEGTQAWVDAFRRTLGMINLRDLSVESVERVMAAARTGRLADDAVLEARVRTSMLEYRVFDLLVHELDPRPRHFPDAIHATTIERPGRLSIWLVRRGRSHLPWHGVGAVDGRDRVRVGPLSELAAQGDYQPVHLPGEDTPFFYRHP